MITFMLFFICMIFEAGQIVFFIPILKVPQAHVNNFMNVTESTRSFMHVA